MFCKHCGNEIKDRAVFCSKCGNSVVDKNAARRDNDKTEMLSAQSLKAARSSDRVRQKVRQTAVKNIEEPDDGDKSGRLLNIILSLSALLLFILIIFLTIIFFNNNRHLNPLKSLMKLIGRESSSEESVKGLPDETFDSTIAMEAETEPGKDEAKEDSVARVEASDRETSTSETTVAETTALETPPVQAVYDVTEGGLHRYEIIVEDCTWNQALSKAKQMGGYLVRINSKAEYQHLLSEINRLGYTSVSFFMGGRRDIESREYYWVDENNSLYGNVINSPDYWAGEEWMSNEPSFTYSGEAEQYLEFHYDAGIGRWIWNDIADDALRSLGSHGYKTGYIVEFE